MYYLFLLSLFYIISYFVIIYFFQLFFNGKIGNTKFNVFHIIFIVVFYFLVIFFTEKLSIIDFEIVKNVSNIELANRLLHSIGGGFLMVILSFFAYKASLVKLTKFQFFFISIMIATCFGVLNELAESIGQVGLGIKGFSPYIADTWFDLWANSIGALVGNIFAILNVDKKVKK